MRFPPDLRGISAVGLLRDIFSQSVTAPTQSGQWQLPLMKGYGNESSSSARQKQSDRLPTSTGGFGYRKLFRSPMPLNCKERVSQAAVNSHTYYTGCLNRHTQLTANLAMKKNIKIGNKHPKARPPPFDTFCRTNVLQLYRSALKNLLAVVRTPP